MARRGPLRKRPFPPVGVAALGDDSGRFAPAPEVLAWLRAEILAEDGTIHNPDHGHLIDADLQVLWAPGAATKAAASSAPPSRSPSAAAHGSASARSSRCASGSVACPST